MLYVKTNPMGFITDGECPNCKDRRITLYYPVGENLLARCNHCGCLFNVSPNEEQVYYSGRERQEQNNSESGLFWIFIGIFFILLFLCMIFGGFRI